MHLAVMLIQLLLSVQSLNAESKAAVEDTTFTYGVDATNSPGQSSAPLLSSLLELAPSDSRAHEEKYLFVTGAKEEARDDSADLVGKVQNGAGHSASPAKGASDADSSRCGSTDGKAGDDVGKCWTQGVRELAGDAETCEVPSEAESCRAIGAGDGDNVDAMETGEALMLGGLPLTDPREGTESDTRLYTEGHAVKATGEVPGGPGNTSLEGSATAESTDHTTWREPEGGPWEAYEIVAESDPVASWEVLRQAQLCRYTFKYDKRQGRQQIGVLPADVARLIPEAFSTFTMPVVLPDGSFSQLKGVPRVDWTYLFAHNLAVTQELHRRFEELDRAMEGMAEASQNASSRVLRMMERQGEDWKPAAHFRELAAIAELERDIVKIQIHREEVLGRERRRWLAAKHNQTLSEAKMELDTAMQLADERMTLKMATLAREEESLRRLEATEEALRGSNDEAIILLDHEVATQTARLAAQRRLNIAVGTIKEAAASERSSEAADVARIKARGKEARKQMQSTVDDFFTLVGAMVLSAVSDPVRLAKITALVFGLVFVCLLVTNCAAVAAGAVRRRVLTPALVRETDLPNSLLAVGADWARRALLMCLRLGQAQPRPRPLPSNALEGVIVPPHLESRLRQLTTSIRASHHRRAPLPHLLVHGATGSGKSLLARRVVSMCGLKRIVVAGGDIGALGTSASGELSSLLRWAGGKPGGARGRGVALIIDEAEAALGDRRGGMSEIARSALNTILLHTGEPRPGFMMVLTSSRAQDLDEAVLDRVDEVVHLPLPTLAERVRLARHFFSIYLRYDAGPIPVNNAGEPGRNAVCARQQNLGLYGAKSTAASREPEIGERIDSEAHLSTDAPSGAELETRKSNVRAGERSQAAAASEDRAGMLLSFAQFLPTLILAWTRRRFRGKALGAMMSSTAISTSAPVRPPGASRNDRLGTIFPRRRRNRATAFGVIRFSDGFRENAAKLVAELAVRSKGFYGRDMARVFAAMQASVYGSESCELTEAMWAKTERQKLREFQEKVRMTASSLIASASTFEGVQEPSAASTAKGSAGDGRREHAPAAVESKARESNGSANSTRITPLRKETISDGHSISRDCHASVADRLVPKAAAEDVTTTETGIEWSDPKASRLVYASAGYRRGLSPACDPEVTRPESCVAPSRS